MIYELYEDSAGGKAIKWTDNNNKISYIPLDETNSDYQRYLAWLENPEAEQSTPSVTNGD